MTHEQYTKQNTVCRTYVEGSGFHQKWILEIEDVHGGQVIYRKTSKSLEGFTVKDYERVLKKLNR